MYCTQKRKTNASNVNVYIVPLYHILDSDHSYYLYETSRGLFHFFLKSASLHTVHVHFWYIYTTSVVEVSCKFFKLRLPNHFLHFSRVVHTQNLHKKWLQGASLFSNHKLQFQLTYDSQGWVLKSTFHWLYTTLWLEDYMERFLGSKKPWLKTCTGIAQPWRNGGSRIFLPVDTQFVTKKPIAHLKLSCFG